jgi:hypothetical protein
MTKLILLLYHSQHLLTASKRATSRFDKAEDAEYLPETAVTY